jgi:hypothetical protein
MEQAEEANVDNTWHSKSLIAARAAALWLEQLQ